MKFWHTLYRIASIVFAVVVVIAVISAFLPKFRQNQERQRRITALEKENQRKENSIKVLRKQQDKLSSDSKYAEKLAREELGKSKPGETIYRFGGQKTNDQLPRRR